MKEKSTFRRLTDKLYGGIDLTWSGIILYALGTAVLTTVFLVLPVFKDSSFARMGETLEAWIFFAVIIIANAKKPLESALKTFVFFSDQASSLIYLFRVPFTFQGWGIFRYYPHWFMLTLGTFPAAYIGWYIKKRNWLSLLILMPVLILLAVICESGLRYVIHEFPRLLIMVLFCIGQVLLYLYLFPGELWHSWSMSTPTAIQPLPLQTETVPISTISISMRTRWESARSISRQDESPPRPVLREGNKYAYIKSASTHA